VRFIGLPKSSSPTFRRKARRRFPLGGGTCAASGAEHIEQPSPVFNGLMLADHMEPRRDFLVAKQFFTDVPPARIWYEMRRSSRSLEPRSPWLGEVTVFCVHQPYAKRKRVILSIDMAKI